MGAGVMRSASWSILGPTGGGAEGGAGYKMPLGQRLVQRDGFIAGGLLLSDPQLCGQSPQLGLQDGAPACCGAVHSGIQ